MAEHVFESPLVEEFYNSCHYKANGKFCGTGTKGKVAKQVPMSDAARASNAALRAKAAKTRKKMKAGKATMERQAAKVKVKTRKEYGSGKTDPDALSLTQKYGGRNRPAAKSKAVSPKSDAPKAKKDYGSGKTEPGALSLTKRFGTASRGKKVVAPPKYGKDNAGSGKTDPSALSLTQKYGGRRRTDDAGKPYVIDPKANRAAANAQIAKTAKEGPSGKKAYKGSKTPAQLKTLERQNAKNQRAIKG